LQDTKTLSDLINPGVYTVLDVETTTSNKGHPFDPRNKLVSYAYKLRNSPPCFKYFTDPDVYTDLEHIRISNNVLIGFNFKFDCHWLYPLGISNPVWDCQLAEHIYTGQRAQFISLNECLIKYGLETKSDLVKEYWDAGVNTDEIPVDILKQYNEWDVIQTEKLFLVQQKLLSDKQKELVYILGEDLKVLASIEQAGLLFDAENARKYLQEAIANVVVSETLLNDYLPPITHGQFNWDSGDHLSCFLYGGILNFDYAIPSEAVYKSGPRKGEVYTKNSWSVESVSFKQLFVPLEGTETKKTKDKQVSTRYYQTDAPTLASLKGSKENKRILGLLTSRSETQKVVEMLESVFKQFNDKQWTENLIHGQFNQNVAVTGRLSSSAPNMQNQPPEVEQFFVSRYD